MKKLIFYIPLLLIFFISCKKDGPTQVPEAPFLLKGEMSAIYPYYNEVRAEVNLYWNDTSATENGFKIERKSDTSGFIVVGATRKNVTTYKDYELLVNKEYTYRISAYNDIGSSTTYSNEIKLVTAFFPKVTTKSVTDTSGISALCGGDIVDNGMAFVTMKGVVWSTSPKPTIDLPTKTEDGNDNKSYWSVISNLAENTKYYVRAYATNAGGTGYGNELSFTTNNINTNKGLMVFYPFAGNPKDSSGNGYHGVVTNATLYDDRFYRFNKSYKFDSYSSYITLPLVKLLNYKQQLTFAFWIYSDFQYPISPAGVFSHWTSIGNPTNSVGINIGINGSNAAKPYSVDVKMSGAGTATSESNVLTSWTWHSVIIVYDGLQLNPTNRLKLYIDGVDKGNFGNDYIPAFTNNIANTSIIGATTGINSNVKINYFKGAIDEFRIYNRIITSDEINFIAKH